MDKGLVLRIAEIDRNGREASEDYYNTTVLFRVPDQEAKIAVPYDLRDVLEIGALTNSDVLLPGATGSGKTHLPRMLMTAWYGMDEKNASPNYTNLTVTPGLSDTNFVDVDVPAIKAGEKTLQEAVQPGPLIYRPGAIINEINRTPEILQNAFIAYLERIYSNRGLDFPCGVPFDSEKRQTKDPHYQFRVVTINEGGEYSGTSGIDRAVRDRVVLEVRMDMFYPRGEDSWEMIDKREDSDLSIDVADGGMLEEILRCVTELKDVPVEISAKAFLNYLKGLDNCVKSQNKSKRGFAFDEGICDGCHHSKKQEDYGNICGSVYAPSNRSIINLKKIGQAVAALRARKVLGAAAAEEADIKDPKEYLENVSVSVEDLTAVAPFVLENKMLINPKWVGNRFKGSRFSAVRGVIDHAEKRFREFVSSNTYQALLEAGGEITPGVRQALENYAEQRDAWAYNLRDLEEAPFSLADGDISRLL